MLCTISIFSFTPQMCNELQTKTIKDPLQYNYNPRSVVLANQATKNLSTFLPSNNDSFKRPMKYSTASDSALSIVTVDHFNNDTHFDSVIAYFRINSIGIFLRWGNGSIVNHTVIFTNAFRPLWIHLTNLNNDTSLDMVTARYHTVKMKIILPSLQLSLTIDSIITDDSS